MQSSVSSLRYGPVTLPTRTSRSKSVGATLSPVSWRPQAKSEGIRLVQLRSRPALRLLIASRTKKRRSSRSTRNTFTCLLSGVIGDMSTSALHNLSFSPTTVGLCFLGLYGAYQFVRFVTADADLRLLRRSKPPKGFFKGKVVWVTGASQGVGEEIAKAAGALGAKVILTARREDRLQQIATDMGGDRGHVAVVAADVTQGEEALVKAVEAAEACFEGAGVDILIHAAGSSQRGRVEETRGDVDAQLFALNTYGPIALTKAMLPHLLQRRAGQIVVVSSMAAKVPTPGQATYAAAKAAVSSFHHSLHWEVCDRGVDVTVVYPGPLASGTEDKPRTVYGPDGPEYIASSTEKKRVSVQRMVELTLAAAAHRLEEAWIARHPVLFVAYLAQYWPVACAALLRKIGPKRARAVRSAPADPSKGPSGLSAAGDGYSIWNIMKSEKKQ